MVWHIIKYWVTFFIPAYYKRIQVNSLKNLKVKGPVILAMNHPNAFMDAVAITFLCYPIRTHYLARGDVFKSTIISWFLRQIGIVPIFRIQDEGKAGLLKNNLTYQKVNELLKKNAKLIVFAEGLCVQERRLRPLKKGVARMVFGAYEFLKSDNLMVLPIGINYSNPSKFRSDLFYNIGEPIFVKEFIDEYKENSAKANNSFLKILEFKMKSLINQIDNKSYDRAVYFYESLCKRDLLESKKLNYKILENDFMITKLITESVNRAAIQNQNVLDEFMLKASVYFEDLKKSRLKDWLINPKQKKQVNKLVFCIRFILVLFGFPFYFMGLLGNYIPYLLTKNCTKKVVKNKEFFSSVAIAFAMIFFLLNYILWFFITYLFSPNIFYPFLICVLFILTGWLGLNYHPFKAKTMGIWIALTNKELLIRLLNQRDALLVLINKF